MLSVRALGGRSWLGVPRALHHKPLLPLSAPTPCCPHPRRSTHSAGPAAGIEPGAVRRELGAAAARVASLAEQQHLSPAEAARLSSSIADCLRLQHEYEAALAAHSALALAGCVRAFESDEQLAHVLREGRIGSADRSAPLPLSPSPHDADDDDTTPRRAESEQPEVGAAQQGPAHAASGSSVPSAVSPPGPSAGGEGVDVEVEGGWPWDPLPGIEGSDKPRRFDE